MLKAFEVCLIVMQCAPANPIESVVTSIILKQPRCRLTRCEAKRLKDDVISRVGKTQDGL